MATLNQNPNIVLSFESEADYPKTLPNIPLIQGGAVPLLHDALQFHGDPSLYIVKGRVFSFDETGTLNLVLSLAKQR